MARPTRLLRAGLLLPGTFTTAASPAVPSTLHERGVQTVAIGDIRDIRQRIDYGHKANEKLHQMPSGLIRHMLTYKAQRRGMQVVLQDERYTSRTCPSCTRRHKPRGRRFRCPWCGFVAHRDVVGAWNIRKEYLGGSPVVGAMASPRPWRPPPECGTSPTSDVARCSHRAA